LPMPTKSLSRARSRTTGAVLNRLREMCLSFPETKEVSSWGHPNFRAGKKTFATFETFVPRGGAEADDRSAGPFDRWIES
jgi:hypothetical protein